VYITQAVIQHTNYFILHNEMGEGGILFRDVICYNLKISSSKLTFNVDKLALQKLRNVDESCLVFRRMAAVPSDIATLVNSSYNSTLSDREGFKL
jgi:hypothetical protein